MTAPQSRPVAPHMISPRTGDEHAQATEAASGLDVGHVAAGEGHLPPRPRLGDPVVSVIIACHGETPAELRQQLASLAAQETPWNWELLIADNGIGPLTRQVVAEFAGQVPELRVIPAAERAGQSYAINTAVQQSRSQRLVLLDCDDVVTSGYLTAMADALRDHPFVGGRMDSSALNAPWLRERRGHLQSAGLDALLDDSHLSVIGAAMAMTRETFDLAGGFDENLRTQQDMDLSWRLHQAGISACYVPSAVILYRYRPTLAGIFAQEREYGRGAAQLFAKHRHNGLPGRPVLRSLRGWFDVVSAVPGMRTQAGRARLATVLGAALGRIEGSIRHRVLYL